MHWRLVSVPAAAVFAVEILQKEIQVSCLGGTGILHMGCTFWGCNMIYARIVCSLPVEIIICDMKLRQAVN
jgi:hypothetical protein